MDIVQVLYKLSQRSDINLSAEEERALENAIVVIERANLLSLSVLLMKEDLEKLDEPK